MGKSMEKTAVWLEEAVGLADVTGMDGRITGWGPFLFIPQTATEHWAISVSPSLWKLDGEDYTRCVPRTGFAGT